MKNHPCIYLFFTLLLPSSTVSRFIEACRTVAGVEPTCRDVSRSHPSTSFAYCVSSLTTIPNANSLDLLGLATATTNLAIAHAESIETRVGDLMDLEPDPEARKRYRGCHNAYGDAANQLKDAYDSLNAKHYKKAIQRIHAANGAYEKCEKGLVLRQIDEEYEKLGEIAAAIADMIDW